MATRARSGATTAIGLLTVVCCLAGPAVAGAVAGSAIGGWLGVAAAALVAPAVGGALLWRRRRAGADGAC